MKKRRHLFLSTCAVLAACVFAYSGIQNTRIAYAAYIPEGAITIDRDFSDWDSTWQVIDETSVEDIDYTYSCNRGDGNGWTEVNEQTECVGGYVYNEPGQIDLRTGYFGLNEKYMYVGFESAFPMMAAYEVNADNYVSVFMLPHIENPITTLPQDFNHEMVFAFGPTDTETFSYYIVAHLDISSDLSAIQDYEVVPAVYQESGDAVGYDEFDTYLGSLTQGNNEENSSDPSNASAAFETKVDITEFFALTGMSATESYGFRIETHSDIGDVSDRVIVDFAAGTAPETTPENIRATDIKKRAATVRWAAVNGATFYKVKLIGPQGKTIKVFKNVPRKHKVIGRKFLKKDRLYTVQVKACNDAGCGSWSSPFQFNTLSE